MQPKKHLRSSFCAVYTCTRTLAAKAARKNPKRKPHSSECILSPSERRQMAGHTLCHETTIMRWEAGWGVSAATRKLLDDTARRMGLPVPERKQ